MSQASAMTLYQSLLDPLTDAIMTGDVDGFVAGLQVPYVLRTVDSAQRFETLAELRQGTASYFKSLKNSGITRMERTCKSAVFKSDTEIEGYNSVRAYRGDDFAILPFLARMRIEQRDGDWRIHETDLAVLQHQWHKCSADEARPGQTNEQIATDEREFHLACFQLLLNWLSQAALCRDFEAWSRACALPLSVSTKSVSYKLKSEEELRCEFDYYMASFEAHNVTDVIREPIEVRVENENRMVGTCRTYVLSHANLVVEPYISTLVIERLRDGLWQLAAVENAIGHKDWQSKGRLQ